MDLHVLCQTSIGNYFALRFLWILYGVIIWLSYDFSLFDSVILWNIWMSPFWHCKFTLLHLFSCQIASCSPFYPLYVWFSLCFTINDIVHNWSASNYLAPGFLYYIRLIWFRETSMSAFCELQSALKLFFGYLFVEQKTKTALLQRWASFFSYTSKYCFSMFSIRIYTISMDHSSCFWLPGKIWEAVDTVVILRTQM